MSDIQPAASSTDSVPTEPREHKFEFNGQTGEFFGIWFVNVFLTILTLGLYAPWAKVRTQQYFYGHTRLAGGTFQFLAKPMDLLKTRLIGVALLLVFLFAQKFAGVVTTATVVYVSYIVIYMLIAPVLFVLVASFRLRYSAWRGISFKFNKDFAGAYRIYLGPSVLSGLFIIALFAPFYFAAQERAAANAKATDDVASIEDGRFNDDVLAEPDDDAEAEYASAGAYEATEDSEIATEPDLDADQDPSAMSEQPDPTAEPDQPPFDTASDGQDYMEDGELTHDQIDGKKPNFFDGLSGFAFLPAAILALLYAGLFPYFDFISSRFLARNARFGTAAVTFHATAKDYYRVFGGWLGATAVFAGVMAALGYGAFSAESGKQFVGLAVPIIVAYILVSKAYIRTRRYNLLFGNLEIGQGHRLHANTTVGSYLWLMISNSVGYGLSVGLLKAWVMVRTARYFLDRTSLHSESDFGSFVAGEKQAVSSLAEETADVFDLDVG